MSTRERPTRTAGGPHDDYTESHPAYAVIGASRVTSTPGATLFNSDFRHGGYMVITIKRAELHRGLSHDWVHGRDQLIEVALSEAQWATFLSTPNVGDGVPCTLGWFDGPVPGIDAATDRREQLRDEVDVRLQDSLSALDELREAIDATTLSQVRKTELQRKAERARQQLTANLPYVARQFDEHAEQTIERAKVEVAAYMTQAIQRAGLQALAGARPIELADPTPVNEEVSG